jgi:GPI mannosyltransferase 3
MVAAITIAFVIRNTSVIAWPVILLIKMIREKIFMPIFKAGVIIFIPIFMFSVLLDSYYFGWDEFPVITPLNFLKINVRDGHSNYFGTEPFYYYFSYAIPHYFIVLVPFLYISIAVYIKDTVINKSEAPYAAIIVFSYLTVYSLIKHKEVRFILPTLPFMCLMLGHTV